MKRRISLAKVTMFLTIAGCATQPHKVAPLPVSTLDYLDLPCEQLTREPRPARNEVAIYTEKQDCMRNRHIALNVLLLAGFGAISSDHEECLGTAKGSVEAIETVTVDKDCALPPIALEEGEADGQQSPFALPRRRVKGRMPLAQNHQLGTNAGRPGEVSRHSTRRRLKPNADGHVSGHGTGDARLRHHAGTGRTG